MNSSLDQAAVSASTVRLSARLSVVSVRVGGREHRVSPLAKSRQQRRAARGLASRWPRRKAVTEWQSPESPRSTPDQAPSPKACLGLDVRGTHGGARASSVVGVSLRPRESQVEVARGVLIERDLVRRLAHVPRMQLRRDAGEACRERVCASAAAPGSSRSCWRRRRPGRIASEPRDRASID